MKEVTLEEFIKENKERQLHICKNCEEIVELVLESYKIQINDKIIKFDILPQVKCTDCNTLHLTDRSKKIIVGFYKDLEEKNQDVFSSKFNHQNKRYSFCESYDFKYDYLDYENIPGLKRMGDDGFLTPVFFQKQALIYFFHTPKYELELGSETYGKIGTDEFIVPFGINTNDKVVMWLGDLEKLDDETLSFLKSQNVESDHKLMKSEFYLAQICCEWSEPIIEKKIVNLRNKVYDLLKNNHDIALHKLEEEVLEVIDDVKKPISYSELEVKSIISALHKILIEAVEKREFKKYYRNNSEDVEEDYTDCGSIKYFEFLLLKLLDKDSLDEEVKDLIAPLYLLNDLRIIYFHLLSDRKVKRKKKNIIESLDLASFDNTKKLYKRLINKLYELYKTFVELLQN
ncbi:hypothetical protein [Halanaerobacter jeridensis]|uniref:Uncharacterized protein n=1 Tax=Halanaerobacter jeridensis TaxID=706427 RepID=A0A939BQH5_9FIRM|nr:hypothetical protein [Halanaerobacter jeridensis]MBM7558173.1 hypothetical protein [Halanaerobacter jeridensis]